MDQSPITPDSTVMTKVETYRATEWWKVIATLLKRRKSGSIELHCSQGAVAVVQWKEKQ